MFFSAIHQRYHNFFTLRSLSFSILDFSSFLLNSLPPFSRSSPISHSFLLSLSLSTASCAISKRGGRKKPWRRN